MPPTASAGEITSVYSSLSEQECRRLSLDEESETISRLCKGVAGLDVYWAEGDLRTFMAYGKAPQTHCSAQQTFGAFNHVGKTIEWRLEDGKPFAVIHRWHVSQGGDGSVYKSWLGVTRIEEGNSCRVAVVEGSLPDANRRARDIADSFARSFNCRADTAQVIASGSRSVDELMSGSPCAAEEASGSGEAGGGTTDARASSRYYQFDLDQCTQTEPADEYVFEGSWACPAIKGYSIFVSAADGRNFVGFGTEADDNCALFKTFGSFNAANGPVEIRFLGGEPAAAIQRWTVQTSPDDPTQTASWLVVNKLQDGTSCHMHYVSGSYPDANDAARRAADTLAEGFDCERDVPTYDSRVGPPPIALLACKDLARN